MNEDQLKHLAGDGAENIAKKLVPLPDQEVITGTILMEIRGIDGGRNCWEVTVADVQDIIESRVDQSADELADVLRDYATEALQDLDDA